MGLSRAIRSGRVCRLFVLTDRIKDVLAKALGDALQNRITVVPDPVELFDPIPQDLARDQLGIEATKPLFVFLGALTCDKGVDLFLEALPLVRGEWIAILAGSPFMWMKPSCTLRGCG